MFAAVPLALSVDGGNWDHDDLKPYDLVIRSRWRAPSLETSHSSASYAEGTAERANGHSVCRALLWLYLHR